MGKQLRSTSGTTSANHARSDVLANGVPNETLSVDTMPLQIGRQLERIQPSAADTAIFVRADRHGRGGMRKPVVLPGAPGTGALDESPPIDPN